MGYNAESGADYAIAIGYKVQNNNANSVEIGWNNTNKIVFNATDGLIVPDLRINQAASAITTETISEFVTISINGVDKKIAIVA